MVSPADAEALRRAQAGIRSLVERDLRGFFGMLDLSRPERARDLLLAFVPELVRQYGQDAAEFAAEWYDLQRASAGVAGRFQAVALVSPYESAAEPTVRRLAGHLFSDTPTEALAGLLAASGKYVLAAPRETIARAAERDPRAVGWSRVARPGACGFCRMLVGRGAVYKQSTAHFASHGHCNCAAVPSWDQDAPEVDVRAYVASQRTTGMSPQQLEAHRARVRAWLADD